MEKFESRFPVFTSLFKTVDWSSHAFIFVYHVNSNNGPYLEYWVKRVKTLAVISIPYSENLGIKQQLCKYTRVISPASTKEIPSIIEHIAAHWKKKNIVLVEIGGYSAQVSPKLDTVVLTVETTKQGYWSQLASQHTRNYPIVTLAQSYVKRVENRYVGECMVRAIESFLAEYAPGRVLQDQTVGVISYGNIGGAVASALQAKGLAPCVYDLDPIKHTLAYASGFTIASKEDLLKKSDIIIACTGKNSITLADIAYIKDKAVLFSGSSKQVEFSDVLHHATKASHEEAMFQQYMLGNKTFFVAYRGEPINFRDTIDPEPFEVQLATALACIKYGLENTLSNEIHLVPLEQQMHVFRLFVESKC